MADLDGACAAPIMLAGQVQRAAGVSGPDAGKGPTCRSNGNFQALAEQSVGGGVGVHNRNITTERNFAMATNYTPTDAKNDLKGAAQETASDVRSATENLGHEARDAWNKATDQTTADKVKHTASDVASDVRERGQEMLETARERGSEYADKAKREADRLYRAGERRVGEVAHYAEDYYDEMSDMVRRKPAQALGIAAGVGFLVGLILARR
ncbi:hypothetical protein [uncultured Paracoccus sp.]|uniref:DUF883 family protein n=1 Tax=uncultured Paracoccus sp. TaxID=189685 RepID=UPI002638C36E|nr:hypothetical protein [uncultured Paracoccus sp.]